MKNKKDLHPFFIDFNLIYDIIILVIKGPIMLYDKEDILRRLECCTNSKFYNEIRNFVNSFINNNKVKIKCSDNDLLLIESKSLKSNKIIKILIYDNSVIFTYNEANNSNQSIKETKKIFIRVNEDEYAIKNSELNSDIIHCDYKKNAYISSNKETSLRYFKNDIELYSDKTNTDKHFIENLITKKAQLVMKCIPLSRHQIKTQV